MATSVNEKVATEQDLLEAWVHRWGCAVSESIIDTESQIFRIPSMEGFIGYRTVGSCAVIKGDPVCAPENMSRLAEAFAKYCQENNWHFIYMITTENFANWAFPNICPIMVQVGEELIFDPKLDPTEGRRGHRLRNKMSHVLHLGLKAYEYEGQDERLEKSIQEAGEKWLKKRKGPQIYLGPLKFFSSRTDKRWFYISKGNEIMAAALLSKLEKSEGWLLKFLITVPEAPRGTSEYLMLFILETLRKENCHFLTYGIVPADRLNRVEGVNQFFVWLGRTIFKVLKWVFKLNHRKLYWEKFFPKSEPSYILFSNPNVGINEIKAIIKALKVDYK